MCCVCAEAQFEYINKWGALIAIHLCMRAPSHAQWKSIERFSRPQQSPRRKQARDTACGSRPASAPERASSLRCDRRRLRTYSSNQEKISFFAQLGGNFWAIFLTIFVLHSLLFPQVNHQLAFRKLHWCSLFKCSFVGFNWAIVLVNYHQSTFMTWCSIGGNLSWGRSYFS